LAQCTVLVPVLRKLVEPLEQTVRKTVASMGRKTVATLGRKTVATLGRKTVATLGRKTVGPGCRLLPVHISVSDCKWLAF
jgi:hypothetical protein